MTCELDVLDIEELLAKLIDILPRLYHAGSKLPRIRNSNEYNFDRFGGFDYDFCRYGYSFAMRSPYEKEYIEESLSGALEEIAWELETGLCVIYEKNIDRIAAAIEGWRINFDGPAGWGETLLRALTAIHFAANDLWKRKLESWKK